MWDLKEAAAYYKRQGAPADQTALVAFLQELQSEHSGSIPQSLLEPAARELGTKASLLLALIRRLPSLRLREERSLEICGGPRCRGAAIAEQLQKEFPDVQVKLVGCQRMCGKGPNARYNGKLYHKAGRNLLRQLLLENE